MALCSATTAAGRPCKNHAVEGSELCSSHGGRVPAEVREKRYHLEMMHGFYAPVISEDEYADLVTYAEKFDLADELAMARVRLRRIAAYIDEHEQDLTPDEYGRLNKLIFRAIGTIQQLVASLDGQGMSHWDIVLNQLSIDLGMDL
jgi:hypothetical protein